MNSGSHIAQKKFRLKPKRNPMHASIEFLGGYLICFNRVTNQE